MCHSKHRRNAPIVIINPQAADPTTNTTPTMAMYGYPCTCRRRRCRCGGTQYMQGNAFPQPTSMIGVNGYPSSSSPYGSQQHHCHRQRRGPISRLIGGVVGLAGYASQKYDERKALKKQPQDTTDREFSLSSSRSSSSSLSSSTSSTSEEPSEARTRRNKPAKISSQRGQTGEGFDETMDRVAAKEWDEHQRNMRSRQEQGGENLIDSGLPAYRP